MNTNTEYNMVLENMEEKHNFAVRPKEREQYCMVTFVYEGKTPTLRYIPLEEMKDCYFPICNSPTCANLKTHHIHPWGMKGCPKHPDRHNICRGKNCLATTDHIFGQHKKCPFSKEKNRYHKDPLPNFIKKHLTTVIPEREYVYHFDKHRFGKNINLVFIQQMDNSKRLVYMN